MFKRSKYFNEAKTLLYISGIKWDIFECIECMKYLLDVYPQDKWVTNTHTNTIQVNE